MNSSEWYKSQRMIEMELFCYDAMLNIEEIESLDFDSFSLQELSQMRNDIKLGYSFWASERSRYAAGEKSLFRRIPIK